jgi:hypothetical protein
MIPGRPPLSTLPAMARIKVDSFTIHASREQALQWARVARYLGCRSVSAWLEELADEQARRVEHVISKAR